MAGPWEKYQAPPIAASKPNPNPKPWDKFGSAAITPPVPGPVPTAAEPAAKEPEDPSAFKTMLRGALEHPATQAAFKGLDYAGGLARTGAMYSPPAMLAMLRRC